ncbi:SubName: Full=Related to CLC1-clathrin light chain {ECO:0000313/EMBL:CCA68515.1} [Serendipita indica DSM 11827]|nr:SubName: Full=Related to CLC1-clathrin light chain {ECO:0000313/EMBL:CCA68515.1} [Serendipita indica DSM 11827]
MDAFDDNDEFVRASSTFPALEDDLDGFGGMTTAAPAPIQNIPSEPLDFDFDPLPASNAPPPVQQPPSVPTFGATRSFAGTPVQPPAYAQPSITPAFEEEPQVIKDWREKQQAEIAKRDERSARRREDIKKQANESIDEFYIEHKAKVERNIKDNKLREEEFRAKLTESLSAGTTWSRICEIIELENSQSKTIARTGAGTTDLTRYKEVLLRLKREGTSAPGAAGY